VGVRPRTDRQTDRHTHRRAWPQYILRRLWLTQNVTKRHDDCGVVRTTTSGLLFSKLGFSGHLLRRLLLATKTTFKSRVLTGFNGNFLLNAILQTHTAQLPNAMSIYIIMLFRLDEFPFTKVHRPTCISAITNAQYINKLCLNIT